MCVHNVCDAQIHIETVYAIASVNNIGFVRFPNGKAVPLPHTNISQLAYLQGQCLHKQKILVLAC